MESLEHEAGLLRSELMGCEHSPMSFMLLLLRSKSSSLKVLLSKEQLSEYASNCGEATARLSSKEASKSVCLCRIAFSMLILKCLICLEMKVGITLVFGRSGYPATRLPSCVGI